MIILLSPAKSLDFAAEFNCQYFTFLYFEKEIKKLIAEMKKFSISDLEKLMKISPKLAELNFARFQNFSAVFNQTNSRQALLAFDGDVYDGIDKKNFDAKDFEFAQNHLRILSGLYGLLKPLDLIQPYRLEMGADFKNFPIAQNLKVKNLYEFWGDKISNYLDEEAKTLGEKHIINLASEEYFSVLNPQKISAKIINIIFKERKNGVLKIIGINAKKARGLMTNFVIKNKISDVQKLKNFSQENYQFAANLSDELNWVFTR